MAAVSGMADSSRQLRIELLGPVEAWVGDQRVGLGGQRPRALFAFLALMSGRVVTSEDLIDELWGEQPPARARDSLQMHVSRLRKALTLVGAEGGGLISQAGGYVLDVRPGQRDVDRWQQTLGQARRARAIGEFAAARAGIDDALRLWRGQALGGVAAHEVLAGERARLEEERLGAIIEGIELDLGLGRHAGLLGQLEALVIAHPFKERLVELQMLALYRAGRQADALAAFHAARTRLVEELGIEPGQPLRERYNDMLRHADTLDADPTFASPVAAGGRGLPALPNRTIGRKRDVDAIGARLRVRSVRLLTLVGPGGVGKTRLALEAARRVEHDFTDGARLVSLASVQRADDVPAAIVRALGIIVFSGESAYEAIERFLTRKHLLLIVDNCEHVLTAARSLGGLLEASPALTILATSRQPLAIHGEERYPVSPLTLPRPAARYDVEALGGVDAVVLFCERARARDPTFDLDALEAPYVAEICRRVDGLPLAIELAAARCGLLSPSEIAERLDTALGTLGTGALDAPARQQTLRATIDWSHELLSDDEKQCFADFAVFAGGATVSAAETIMKTGLDTLDGLLAKSLLVGGPRTHMPARLGMLETIRAYASERFAVSPGRDAVCESHFHYYLALAEGHGSERVLWGADRKHHRAHVDDEIDNLHAALGWAVRRESARQALAMCAALRSYWALQGRPAEAVAWVQTALNLPDGGEYPVLRVEALEALAFGLRQLGRTDDATPVLAEAEAVARDLDDPAIVSAALERRAVREAMDGRPCAAEALADEALDHATIAKDDWAIANAAFARALAAPPTPELRQRVDQAASLLHKAGNIFRLSSLYSSAAYGAICNGSESDAKEFIDAALRIARDDDHPFTWMGIQGNLGLSALLTGDVEAAHHAFHTELALCRELAARPYDIEGLRGLAAVAAHRGEADRAARLLGAATAHRRGQPEDPVDAKLDATFYEAARTLHGAAAWTAASREGRALSFEDAIAYALDDPRGDPRTEPHDNRGT
jgi:predicted ATPase/DNA-binding SARP family transcriptional activator